MKLQKSFEKPVEVELIRISHLDPNLILLAFEQRQFCFAKNGILGQVWQLIDDSEFLGWNQCSFTFDSFLSFVCHFPGDCQMWLCDFANIQEPSLACFREFDAIIECVDYVGQQVAVGLSNGCLYWACRKASRQLITHSPKVVDSIKCLGNAFLTASGNEIQLWMADEDLVSIRHKFVMGTSLSYLNVCSFSDCELLYCATSEGTIWFYWIIDDEDVPLYVIDVNEILTAIASLRWENETYVVCGTAEGNVICFLGNQVIQKISFPEPIIAIEKAYPNQFIICFESGSIKRYEPWSHTWTTILSGLSTKGETSIPVSYAASEDSFMEPTPLLPPSPTHNADRSFNSTQTSMSVPFPLSDIPVASDFQPKQDDSNQLDGSLPPQAITSIPIPASNQFLKEDEESQVPASIPSKTMPSKPFELFRHTKARASKREKLMKPEKMNEILEKKDVVSKSEYATPTPQTLLKLQRHLEDIDKEKPPLKEIEKDVKWQVKMLGKLHPKFQALNHDDNCYHSLPPPAESLSEHRGMKIRYRPSKVKRNKVTIDDFPAMKEFQSSCGIKMPPIPALVRCFDL